MSNFDFASRAWPELADEAKRAERYTFADPRTALFYARRALELTVEFLYRADGTLMQPYKNDLSSRIHEPTFASLVGPGIQAKMNLIRKQGNNAVHQKRGFTDRDSLPVVRELFLVFSWFAAHYAPTLGDRPMTGVPFDAASIPRPQPGAAARTRAELQRLAAEIEKKDLELEQAQARITELEDAALKEQARTAEIKIANEAVPDPTDYREDETRSEIIDLELREAGWLLTEKRDREFPVTGMPGASGKGYVDYVLWGDDGRPLALVEAKRTRVDARAGSHQARLYANALETQFGQRPVIYFTNGFEHWIWDDVEYPPRRVQGFYTKTELALLVQRRSSRRELASLEISSSIAGRHYQQRAVRKVAEHFGRDHQRRALLVMATGSGKTRTVIALTDLLMRANWVKRVLFLADRTALVRQATGAFKQQLPDSAPVNLVEERDGEGRVYVSTYQTMMGLINERGDDGRRFGPGYFDLIVIDEAHRSVYRTFGAIFEYFDALLVGLTATPKDDVDHNTYGLFHLEDGVPTDSYELTDAIDEGFLVAPVAKAVTTDFVRSGIRYDELSSEEQEAWEAAEWVDGVVPTSVSASDINSWLMNRDTVDKVLKSLMIEGRKVAGGDRLGKTIVFAKSTAHARFIKERFDANYPQYRGGFAEVITHETVFAEDLIDRFSTPESMPHIAISVDMLDTGIDVPEVVNLVFFKEVHSKTKFWQMVGRGTRLCRDLYAPGEDKRDFLILDVCQNIEYFNQDLPPDRSSATPSLSARLFRSRVGLVRAIDASGTASEPERAVRDALAARLCGTVQGMTLDNFLVRPHRKAVDAFSRHDAWRYLGEEEAATLARELAELPTTAFAGDTDEKAKRFDLLMHTAQLGLVADGAVPAAVQSATQQIMVALLEQRSVPKVAQELTLIGDLAEDTWWVGVTLSQLEAARLRLRELVGLITVSRQKVIYTDFVDSGVTVEYSPLVIAAHGVNSERFRDKAHAFLVAHQNDLAIAKLRHGKQLTDADLAQLETIFVGSGEFTADEVKTAAEESQGLGRFVRSIVGMDREAASDALGEFVTDATLSSNQIAFVNLIIEQLTRNGSIDLELLWKDPFVSYAPSGPHDIFTDDQVMALVSTLRRVNATADIDESIATTSGAAS